MRCVASTTPVTGSSEVARLFHIATLSDWQAARETGRYTTSTRGRSLAEEGFIHASRGDQWQGVRDRFYADVEEPLVLLTIDPALLTAPVVDEAVPDSDESFPHIYGALDVAAVVTVIALSRLPVPVPPVDAVPPTSAESAPVAPRTPTAPDSTGLTRTTGAEEAGTDAVPVTSFSALFFAEMFHNLVMALVVMVFVVLGGLVGQTLYPEWAPITLATIGLVVGILVARAVHRRWPAS